MKDLISEKTESAVFVKHAHKNKAEQLTTDTNQSETISQVAGNSSTERDLKTMRNTASET